MENPIIKDDSILNAFKKKQDLLLVLVGHLLKIKNELKKIKETGDTSYIYKNGLDKTCFQHDMAYGDSKDLKRRTFSDKVLKDKAFNIAKNPKYDGYQRGLASMVYKCFDTKSALLADKSVSGGGVNIEVMHNEKVAKELHKPIIRNFKKRTVYSGFKDNIWGVYLADRQLLSKYNKGIKYLLCAIDLFSKYRWVVPKKTVLV